MTRISSGIVVGFFSHQSSYCFIRDTTFSKFYIENLQDLYYFIGEEVEEVFAEDYDDPIKESTTPVSTEQGMETGDSQVKPLVHEVSACPNRCFILFLYLLQLCSNSN